MRNNPPEPELAALVPFPLGYCSHRGAASANREYPGVNSSRRRSPECAPRGRRRGRPPDGCVRRSAASPVGCARGCLRGGRGCTVSVDARRPRAHARGIRPVFGRRRSAQSRKILQWKAAPISGAIVTARWSRRHARCIERSASAHATSSLILRVTARNETTGGYACFDSSRAHAWGRTIGRLGWSSGRGASAKIAARILGQSGGSGVCRWGASAQIVARSSPAVDSRRPCLAAARR